MTNYNRQKPEYSYLTCAVCGKEIDSTKWYASLGEDFKVHSGECFNNKTAQLQKSKFKFA